jgi:Ni,Fe-hydrogenase maturation factor
MQFVGYLTSKDRAIAYLMFGVNFKSRIRITFSSQLLSKLELAIDAALRKILEVYNER